MVKPQYKIELGDCLDVLGGLPEHSVDLVIADPPYNIGIDYGDGVKSDKLSRGGYVEFCRDWVRACQRVVKPDGSIFIICSKDYAADIEVLCRDELLIWRNTITWLESFGVHCSKKYSRVSRSVLYFTKSESGFHFDEIASKTPSDRQTKYNDKRAAAGGKTIGDVWEFSRVCGTFKERIKDVPNQIPVELLKRIVAIHSEPGDTVLDPFAGSASTGEAALVLGRNFYGVEKIEKQHAAGVKRLANLQGV